MEKEDFLPILYFLEEPIMIYVINNKLIGSHFDIGYVSGNSGMPAFNLLRQLYNSSISREIIPADFHTLFHNQPPIYHQYKEYSYVLGFHDQQGATPYMNFEIEREIMDDKISVDDLPEIWNQKYLDYLNVEIENDSEGVMQDSHWAGGAIGYFPTYALGNIYSGQILSKMQKDIYDWRNQITKGNLHEVKQWLTENIYRYGNLYDLTDLIKKITDEKLNIQPFLSHLNNKYAKLYGF